MSEVWIVGAGGRAGAAVATALASRGSRLVLVDRDGERLRKVASQCAAQPRILLSSSIEATVAEIGRSNPAVVANFVGPFSQTALPFIRAAAPAGLYLDLANELPAILTLLALDGEARAEGRCLVTGAGFGVLGTEALVLKLCENREAARSVRVDGFPYLSDTEGMLGPSVAGTIVDALAFGGRAYREGKLVRIATGSLVEDVTLPDGHKRSSGAGPAGDLEAARRASGASFVVAASAMAVAHNSFTRAFMRSAHLFLSIPRLRELAKRHLSNSTAALEVGGNVETWTRARAEWSDGSRREGWMRAGDAMDFTLRTATEVAWRLSRNEGRPGAYTPGALFGPDLAVTAGGTFVLN